MAVKKIAPLYHYEQELLKIIHTLPIECIIQIVNFAKYIHLQAKEDFFQPDESEKDVLADEALWESQFASTQDGLKSMAEQIRVEIRAGRSQPMKFTKDGRMIQG